MNLVVYIYVERGTTSISLPREGSVLVGRGPEAEVFVASDDASRRHAELYVKDLEATIRDLDSRNGTFVNGERINGPRQIFPGDQILIGDAVLMIERESDSVRPERRSSQHHRRPSAARRSSR